MVIPSGASAAAPAAASLVENGGRSPAASPAKGSGSDSDSDSASSSSESGGDSGSSSGSDAGSDTGSDSDAGGRGRGKDGPKLLGGAKKRAMRPKRRRIAARAFRKDVPEESSGDAAAAAAPQPGVKAAKKGSGKGKKQKEARDAGDEYDSGEEMVATAEDDAFIDREGDDDELLAEYDAEGQNFDEDAGFARKAKAAQAAKGKAAARKRKRGGEEEEEGEGGEGGGGKKKGGKGKKREMTDAQKSDAVEKLIHAMRAAAAKDRSDRKAGVPAVAKLKLLPEVRLACANTSLQELLLEGVAVGSAADYSSSANPTILACFRDWLRPLPGTDLPPLAVRECVYDCVGRLPVAPHHLKDSRLGEVLFALSQAPSESDRNRVLLKTLIDRFSRMIFGKASSYRGGGIDEMLSAQAEAGLVSRAQGASSGGGMVPDAAAAAAAAAAGMSLPSSDDLDALVGDELEAALAALGDGSAVAGGAGASEGGVVPRKSLLPPKPAYEGRHARIPQAVVFDFVARSRPDGAGAPGGAGGAGAASSLSSAGGVSGMGAGGGKGADASGLRKKLVEKRRELKASASGGNARAVKISIEGRGT